MKVFLEVITAPKNVFTQIKSLPTWKGAFFAVVGGNSLLTWLKSCLRGSSFVADFIILIGSFIISAIVIFVLWSTVALFLHSLSLLFNSQKRGNYKNIFSLVSNCGVIYLVGEILNFILSEFDLVRNNAYLLPNRFPIGLDILFIGRHPGLPLSIILYSINPITIWYLATLSSGLSFISHIDRTRAWIASLCLWAFGVGFIVILAQLLGGTSMGFKVG